MHLSLLAWSALVLSAGPFPSPTFQDKQGQQQDQKQGKPRQKKKNQEQQPTIKVEEVEEEPLTAGAKKWSPFFDYTQLPPANEIFWAPLSQTQIPLERALELAATAEGAPIRVLNAELKPNESGSAWHLQVFVGGGETERPKRVNLQVSSAEEKVLRRVELLSMAPDEEETWKVLRTAPVSADIAVTLCKERSRGSKAEAIVTDPRVRRLEFVPAAAAPKWKCELMGIEKELVRRYEYLVNAAKPNVKQKLLLDRFAGEPLRSGQPSELENGMFVFDFIAGDGPIVTAESKVKVHYRLFLLDNTKLHDTFKSNQPETFVVSQAPLQGMGAGMVGMRVGGKRKIAMPYTLAFGEKGNEIAPPKAMVVCDMAVEELLSE